MDAGTLANQPPFVPLRGSGLLQARIAVQIDRDGAAVGEPRDDFAGGEIHARQPQFIRDARSAPAIRRGDARGSLR